MTQLHKYNSKILPRRVADLLSDRSRLPSFRCLSVIRWGDVSQDNTRVDSKISVVASSPVHQTLVAASTDSGEIGIFLNGTDGPTTSNRAMLKFSVQEGSGRQRQVAGVTGLRFLEEHVLVSSSRQGSIKVWDCTNVSRSKEVLNILSREPVTALTVPAYPGNTVIISGSSGGSVHVRDLRFNSGESDKGMKARSSPITYLCTSSNQYQVIAGDHEGNIDIWDTRSASNIPLSSLNGNSSHSRPGIIAELPQPRPKSTKKPDISEDIWDIAMGKKRKSSQHSDGAVSLRIPPVFQEDKPQRTKAHHDKVVALGVVDSGIIASVSADKTAKLFCKLSGNLLGEHKLKDKPLSAEFHAGMLCVGKRQGFELVESITSSVLSSYSNTSTHVGHVHAVAFAGDWGVCTGGMDHHVFIHRIET